MFTVCFVIVACIIIGGGYAIIKVTGILEPGSPGVSTPTITPVPTPYGPTEIPLPTAPIIIPSTPTPAPTPVPTRYTVNVNYEGDASSRTYKVSYTLRDGSAPINLDLSLFSVWEGSIIYQNYTYGESVMSGAGWSGANGDHLLEKGETFIFKVNGYTLKIPPDTQTQVTFIVDGEVIKTTTLPYLINPDLSNLEPVDPEATLPPVYYG